VIGDIDDRMPAILDERAAEDWMNPREENPLSLERLLVPAPSELLMMQPASPLANSVKNEGYAKGSTRPGDRFARFALTRLTAQGFNPKARFYNIELLRLSDPAAGDVVAGLESAVG
jgi:hypothetical protein